MNKSTQFEPTQVLPGVVLCLRQIKLRIHDVPDIARIVGEQRYQLGEDCDCISMIRTPYVASNPDDTFELVSPVQIIKPDIEGSPAMYFNATEIERRPDSLGAIELLRSHLIIVDANRKSLSDADLLKLIFKGQIDSVLELYRHGRSIKLRGLNSLLSAFGEGRFSPETYYRHKRPDPPTPNGESDSSGSDEEMPTEELPAEDMSAEARTPMETLKPPSTVPEDDKNTCTQELRHEKDAQQPDLFPESFSVDSGQTPDRGGTGNS